MEDLKGRQPDCVEVAEDLSADKGYDSTKNNKWLWDKCEIKPLIDIRSLWKLDETKLIDQEKADNVVYDEAGKVYCVSPAKEPEQRELAFDGFESYRECLKYRCPAAAYGSDCAGRKQCGRGSYGDYGRVVRVKLETDRRIFTPIARSSYAWPRGYKRRSAVERVNSRLDGSFQFERHYIRGLNKMQFRVGLALIIMLALAVGHLKDGQIDKIRSLVQPRAA